MNNLIMPYVYDFLSMIFEDESLKKNVKTVVLFGSVAKKTNDKKSDIDLFFDVINKAEINIIEDKIKSTLKSFEVKSENTWKLKKIVMPINFIVGSLDDSTWKNIKDELASSGIVLYGPYKQLPQKMDHYFLVYYSLVNLARKNKMRLIRTLFGYSLVKAKRKYVQKGLIEKIGASKLSSNVILVQSESLADIKRIFNDYRLKYRVIETWIRL